MKYALIALLMAFNPIWTSAQKNNLFADAGISLAYLNPGFSITYNHKLAKIFGLGIGFQDYNFSPTVTNRNQFIPAVFGDIRFYIPAGKKSLVFPFLDIGIDFYKHNNNYYRNDTAHEGVAHDNGTYIGLGCGYFQSITKRRGGWYVSLKMILNSYEPDEYSIFYRKHYVSYLKLEGTFVLSAGFKF